MFRDGLRREVFGGKRVEANPEFNIQDVREGGSDMVRRVIDLARESECSLLLFPLFAGANYERAIGRAGGGSCFGLPRARGRSSRIGTGRAEVATEGVSTWRTRRWR